MAAHGVQRSRLTPGSPPREAPPHCSGLQSTASSKGFSSTRLEAHVKSQVLLQVVIRKQALEIPSKAPDACSSRFLRRFFPNANLQPLLFSDPVANRQGTDVKVPSKVGTKSGAFCAHLLQMYCMLKRKRTSCPPCIAVACCYLHSFCDCIRRYLILQLACVALHWAR